MIEISVSTVEADWKEFQDHWNANVRKAAPRSWAKRVVDMLIVAGIVVGFIEFHSAIHWPTALVAAIFALGYIGYFFGAYARAVEAAVPKENGLFLGQHRYRFTCEGIFTSGENNACEYRWALVNSVRETENLIILMIDSAAALLIPKRDIKNAAELLKFIEENRVHDA